MKCCQLPPTGGSPQRWSLLPLHHTELVFVPVRLEYLASIPGFQLELVRKRFLSFKMIELLNGFFLKKLSIGKAYILGSKGAHARRVNAANT